MSSDPSRVVIVFARAPLLGQVKTRLAAELGDAEALRIYRDLGRRAVVAASSVGDCRVVIAHTPAAREREVRDWLGGDLRCMPQEGADLGERMLAAVQREIDCGATRVVVIGTDCPGLTGELIEHALEALDRADAVFGPARDGGYYLVALRHPDARLFSGIPWSSPDTLAHTLQRAADSAISVELLPELEDIDTAQDWRRWLERQRGDSRGPDGA